MVLGHNVWSGIAPTVIATVLGWLVLLKSVLIVLLPARTIRRHLRACLGRQVRCLLRWSMPHPRRLPDLERIPFAAFAPCGGRTERGSVSRNVNGVMPHRPGRLGILLFRHLLEAHDPAEQILATLNATLAAKGSVERFLNSVLIT